MPKAKPRRTDSGLTSNDTHTVEFFKRHKDDDPTERAPGYEFLMSCPQKVKATMLAVLTAVATAPPKRYAGGGYWEAMDGGSSPRMHYRLFCRIDLAAQGMSKPVLAVIAGLSKPIRTTLSDRDYSKVRDLGDEYRSRNPRSIMH